MCALQLPERSFGEVGRRSSRNCFALNYPQNTTQHAKLHFYVQHTLTHTHTHALSHISCQENNTSIRTTPTCMFNLGSFPGGGRVGGWEDELCITTQPHKVQSCVIIITLVCLTRVITISTLLARILWFGGFAGNTVCKNDYSSMYWWNSCVLDHWVETVCVSSRWRRLCPELIFSFYYFGSILLCFWVRLYVHRFNRGHHPSRSDWKMLGYMLVDTN